MLRLPLAALALLVALRTSAAHAADRPEDSKSPPRKQAEAPSERTAGSKPGGSRTTRKSEARPTTPAAAPEPAPRASSAAAPPDAKPGSLPRADSPPPAAGLDPKRGRGSRNVDSAGAEEAEARPSEAAPSERPAAKEKEKEKDKPAPAKPEKASKRTTSTRGATRAEPDAAQRQKIAGGPTADELAAGKDDRELRSLREAELVLFPRPLPGLMPGWSWDLPKSVEPSLPEVITGAPPATRAPLLSRDPSPDAAWLRGLSMPNVAVRLEERVLRYLTFYRDTPGGKAIARTWAKKSGRYAQALKAELAKAGLPTDLVWLSLIESGHNPSIVSPAGAGGLWQFMPDAGRAYGLTIDRWVDERFDPLRSTEAACRFLGDLYRRFGSWDLAMAAYNMGYGGLSKAIRKYNTNDFWELARYEAGLPWETTLYVPKILATAIAMNNRGAFGLDDVEPDPPERFETVLVGPSVLLEDIARLATCSAANIEALNPQYLAGRTPPAAPGAAPRSWPVRVPAGAVVAVREALAREAPSEGWFVAYQVKLGDTVESIAQAHGATEAQIRALNRVDPREVLAAGTVLLVPRGEKGREDEASSAIVVVPPRTFDYPGRKRVFYRVSAGDSPTRVAEVFGVSRQDLALWNALDSGARLHPGMTLQLYVSEARDLSRVRHVTEDKARVLIAGAAEFFDYFEGQNGKRRFVVRAKAGDTLAAVGKRYGASVASMERINRRSRTDAVAAGDPIVVYTEKLRPLPGDALYVDSSRDARAAELGVRSGAPAGAAAAVADGPGAD